MRLLLAAMVPALAWGLAAMGCESQSEPGTTIAATAGPGTGGGTTASGSGGSGGEAASSDEAEIVSADFPEAIACKGMGPAHVMVKNVGTSTWTAGDGYKLGAVGDADPLVAEGRILLPEGAAVMPGDSWEFELPLVAPADEASYVVRWQMVRENVSWFGQTAEITVAVDCDANWPPTPDRSDVVQSVAGEYGHLLQTNTWESCGELVQRVLAALDDPDWGHVGKTAGEGQYSPPGFSQVVDGHALTGFSHDVIWHKPSNRQVDIIVNAAANSDPNPDIWGPASLNWAEIPREHYREWNPWLPAVPVAP